MSAYVTRNPADLEDVVTTVDLVDAAGFVDAARRARDAQQEWARVPPPVRGRVIAQVGRLVEDNKPALARLVTREVGKPYAEALGEVQEVVDTCDFFLGEGRRLYGMTVPSEMPDKQLFTFRVPVGVAAIITAANFPAAVPSWYLVPALLCGNAVVWKPAETSAGVALALLELFRQGGVPDGVLDVVLATARRPTPAWPRARRGPRRQGRASPGSSAVGRRIGELAGRHLQSACLELGGKNPMVVMPDADLDLAVEGALFAASVRPASAARRLGTVWAHHDIEAAFRRCSSLPSRTPSSATRLQDVLYGPMLSDRYLEAHERNLDLVAGHHTVHGSTGIGRITAANPRKGFVGDPDRGVFAHPTIVGRRASRRRPL